MDVNVQADLLTFGFSCVSPVIVKLLKGQCLISESFG